MHTNQEKEVLELEKRFWKALQENDVKTAVALTDFPCLLTGPQGVGRIEQQEFVQMMEGAPYRLNRFELGKNPQVRMLGDDVAVIAYEVKEEMTLDGKSVTLEAADSSTWVRRNGKWRCALHTEAITGDPFGRDRAS